MRTIIAGSRHFKSYELVLDAVKKSGFLISSVVAGGNSAIDRLAERYSREHILPLILYESDKEQFGDAAVAIRNESMAKNATALIAVWDGQSPGTANMIETAKRYALQVYVHRIEGA